MDDSEFDRFLADIPALTSDQHQRLGEALQRWTETRPVTELANARLDDRPQCPHCDASDVQRWGHSGGLQRYRCKPCGRTFNPLTGTPLARLRKREQWPTFSETLVEGATVQQAAAHCGLDPSTSFRWRHRFLEALRGGETAPLNGIVEVEETHFTHADKGVRGLQRPARRRGGHQHRGFSHPEQRVLLLLDGAGNGFELLLPSPPNEEPSGGQARRLAGDALLCAGDDASLRQALIALGLEQPLTPLGGSSPDNSSTNNSLDAAFNRDRVQAYVTELRVWIQRFRGVNSRYLIHYLLWRRLLSRGDSELTAGELLALLFR